MKRVAKNAAEKAAAEARRSGRGVEEKGCENTRTS